MNISRFFNIIIMVKKKFIKDFSYFYHEKTMKTTDLSETERQKTPGSLYLVPYSTKANLFCEHMFIFSVFSIHRSDLFLLNMVQGTRSFLSFCF